MSNDRAIPRGRDRPSGRGGRTTTERDLSGRAVVVALVLLGGALPLVIAAHFGALGIARHDDWSYLLTAFRFAEGGGIDGNGFGATGLVGQLVISLPVVWIFGRDVGALQVLVTILSVLGLLAVYDLARLALPPRRALFVAVVLAVGPMWAPLGVSYMTDLPALGLGVLCLDLGIRAVRGPELRRGLLLGALVVGFVAVTVREYAMAAPLAVGLVAFLRSGNRTGEDRRRALVTLTMVGALGIASVAYFLWRQGLPGFTDIIPHLPTGPTTRSYVHKSLQSAVLVGLLVAPAVALAGPYRIVRAALARSRRVTVVVAGLALAGMSGAVIARRPLVSSWQEAIVSYLGPSNYVMSDGTLGGATILGHRPQLLPKPLLVVVVLVGILSLLTLLIAAIPPTLDLVTRITRAGNRSRGDLLGADASIAVAAAAALGYGAPATVPVLLQVAFLDRYLLPLVPLLGILVLRSRGAEPPGARADAILGAATLTGLALVGLAFALNSASFDATKWRVAERAAALVGDREDVLGGFEWTDYHAGEELFLMRRERLADRCVVVRMQDEAPDGSELVSERVWAPDGDGGWIVARRRGPC